MVCPIDNLVHHVFAGYFGLPYFFHGTQVYHFCYLVLWFTLFFVINIPLVTLFIVDCYFGLPHMHWYFGLPINCRVRLVYPIFSMVHKYFGTLVYHICIGTLVNYVIPVYHGLPYFFHGTQAYHFLLFGTLV